MADQEIKINTLEVTFKTMSEQNAKEHSEIKDSLSLMTEKIEQLIDKMDKRYAPMYVRDLVVWGGGIAGSLLIVYALERLLIK